MQLNYQPIKLSFLLLASLMLIACSSDDDSASPSGENNDQSSYILNIENKGEFSNTFITDTEGSSWNNMAAVYVNSDGIEGLSISLSDEDKNLYLTGFIKMNNGKAMPLTDYDSEENNPENSSALAITFTGFTGEGYISRSGTVTVKNLKTYFATEEGGLASLDLILDGIFDNSATEINESLKITGTLKFRIGAGAYLPQ